LEVLDLRKKLAQQREKVISLEDSIKAQHVERASMELLYTELEV